MYTGNCSPVELRGQSAEVRFLLLPHGFHELKEGQMWTILAAFLTHFQLNKSTATLNGMSEGIHSKPKPNPISFLLCTTEGLEITLWSCTSGHATSCHLYFLALDSPSLCGPTAQVLSFYRTTLNLSWGPAQVYSSPQSNHTLISPVFPVLEWVLPRSPLPQRQVSRTRTT